MFIRQGDALSTENRPVEQAAVRTTIVGGRPPGSGKPVGNIPRGIEVLLKKAAVDPEFRELLLTKRSVAADAIGLRLDPIEATMLNMAPAEQLALVIGQTRVDPAVKPVLLGKVAAAMLLALGLVTGLSGAGNDVANASPSGLGNSAAALQADPPAPSAGVAPDRPAPPTSQVEMPIEVAGARADVPVMQWGIRPVPPTSQPGTVATSQPTSQPAAVTPDEYKKILVQLDNDQFTVREAAEKRLLQGGPAILPQLKQTLTDKDLSPEVAWRLKRVVAAIQPKGPVPPDGPVLVAGFRVAGVRPMPLPQIEQNLDQRDINIDGIRPDRGGLDLRQAEPQIVLTDFRGEGSPEYQGLVLGLTSGSPVAQPAGAPTSQPAALAPAEYDKLLKQLDDEQFSVREAAEKALIAQGKAILPQVKQSLAGKNVSAEVTYRLNRVVAAVEPVAPPTDVGPQYPNVSDGIRPGRPGVIMLGMVVRPIEVAPPASQPAVAPASQPAATGQPAEEPPQRFNAKGMRAIRPDNLPLKVAGAMADPPAASQPADPQGQINPPDRAFLANGMRAYRPPVPAPPTSQPVTTPTSQPAAGPVRPLTDTEHQTVGNLIGQLESSEFAVRESAYKGLREMGPVIVPALQEAIKGGKCLPEVSARLGGLVTQLSGGKTDDSPEPVFQSRGARPDRPGNVNRGLQAE
jgi:hypothetical protein